jgi:hypothetical protein
MANPQPGRIEPQRFGGAWAKVEIVLGLAVTGAGLVLAQRSTLRPVANVDWGLGAVGLALFVLGGYLTLAGQRSHLYRALHEQAARLAEALRRSNDKVDPQ